MEPLWIIEYYIMTHARIQRVDCEAEPLNNHKAKGFLSNTGLDPLENHKATKPAFNVMAIIGRPSKRHLNGFSLVGQ